MGGKEWSALWRELSLRFRWPEKMANGAPIDRWTRRAHSFNARVKMTDSTETDLLQEFVLKSLSPESTVLDIGAGTGRWSIPMGRIARRVTAIEPSPSMLTHLRQNISDARLTNITVLPSHWEEAEVEPHDVALCSHAMYASPDLLAFVRKMEQNALRRCFLVMRVPTSDGILGQLSRRIYGSVHDSPNFIIGYNVLYEAGIVANVLAEPLTRPWTNFTYEEALERAKRHLGLSQTLEYDSLIKPLLRERLTFKDGKYYWPDGMRSALLWWDCTQKTEESPGPKSLAR